MDAPCFKVARYPAGLLTLSALRECVGRDDLLQTNVWE